jgi:ubiquinone/menaquinone biosynthesis C-methylase UbiE
MTTTRTSEHVYGTTFAGSAPENYERYFVPVIGRPFATDLVAEAQLRRGERILDVACGTGIVARVAAREVGADGGVAGVDLNEGMLSVARSAAAADRAPIQWYETSAESMPLPDHAFDVVLCQLGLQFVTDKHAALVEMHRVLAPGGRALVSVPRQMPLFEVLHEAVERHVDPSAAAFVRMVFSLHDPAEIERLFERAGFRDVRVRSYSKPLRLPPAKDFLWQYIQCTPLAGATAALSADRLAALERHAVEGWQPWTENGGMTYSQEMLVASGRK